MNGLNDYQSRVYVHFCLISMLAVGFKVAQQQPQRNRGSSPDTIKSNGGGASWLSQLDRNRVGRRR
ncbi:hypothetical protein BDW66DRAFT_136254 [Aspergillus desertorum]